MKIKGMSFICLFLLFYCILFDERKRCMSNSKDSVSINKWYHFKSSVKSMQRQSVGIT
ncbi:hypothetical protein GGR06_002599 [Bacteroides reticulotermitis]|uniref:Uncharacterized protein n=1 Tax=Bacteroides reticulotermitis TaxID=1133319 RepID=A0A840D166_9BACE|nr:hypothetical protein [Bacteroides reticulotermitis]